MMSQVRSTYDEDIEMCCRAFARRVVTRVSITSTTNDSTSDYIFPSTQQDCSRLGSMATASDLLRSDDPWFPIHFVLALVLCGFNRVKAILPDQ